MSQLRSYRFSTPIIDALSAQIAILDAAGVIVAVNTAWTKFCETYGNNWLGACLGENYLDICKAAVAKGNDEARHIIDAIEEVLAGGPSDLNLEHASQPPMEELWFYMQFTRFMEENVPYIVISSENITRRKHAEIALEKSLLALEELSIKDELTQLYNRRHFNQLLLEESQRALRYGRNLTLLIVDVDHFKMVNDTYGHQTGDEVLRWLARSFKQRARLSDYVARYGGEEFAFILPETTDEDALNLAERLRKNIEAGTFVQQFETHKVELRLTISIGVAQYPSDGEKLDALISAADMALYEAKRRGRNCIVRHSPTAAPEAFPILGKE